ncbi:MAG: PLP-dependent aspartate aminotransferase family protein [Acidimicrobiia bacterium]|nr:MAG: PLP-dependent aspartate aminotransferase family protein [Acidimicrobiia bacterium]
MEGFSTRALHADDGISDTPDVAPPISVSTTYEEGTGRRYRRSSHSTTERLEAVLGSLDGGHATAYASGLAAASGVLDHINPGRVSIPDDVYHGVRQLIESRQARGQLVVSRTGELERGDLWWVETPSNPKCLITDLVEVARLASERGIITVCDSTFATPVQMRPLSLGVDVVLHSVTKFISGHSDALGGALITSSNSMAEELRTERTLSGAVPGALDVWLALRGVRTLDLRVRRASESALAIANWFSARGVATWHPGLSGHPGHAIAAEQMDGFGSMMSIDLGSADAAHLFVTNLAVFTNATSLGSVESLAEHRLISDPLIEPGLVRLSVGIEDVSDLIADIDQALG